MHSYSLYLYMCVYPKTEIIYYKETNSGYGMVGRQAPWNVNYDVVGVYHNKLQPYSIYSKYV